MSKKQSKIISILLAILSLISIFAMLHHPSIAAVDIYEQIQEINHEAQTNKLVHGGLIALIVFIGVCLTCYAKLRGLHYGSVLNGLIIYWLGTFSMIFAALMSGIVGPEMAAYYQNANSQQLEVFKGIFRLKSEMNQAFAYFSVFCWCTTIICWAFDMFTQGKWVRLFGITSLVAALLIATGLLSGWITLGVFGMTLILVVISAWQLGVAWLIYSQRASVNQV